MKTITIAHLYPNEMNIYGDMGNIIALRKRLEWRGYEVVVDQIHDGDEYEFTKADIIFGGGGQDSSQIAVAVDLQRHRQGIIDSVDRGVVVLVVCGLYQLFGNYFRTYTGEEIAGIGVFDMHTIAGDNRMIGNVVCSSDWGELIGFENHSGETVLAQGIKPLGRVKKGDGNNSQDSGEGAVYKNAYGTYLHGSFLPKNPAFTDHLIQLALARKYQIRLLEPLDDEIEGMAREASKLRP